MALLETHHPPYGIEVPASMFTGDQGVDMVDITPTDFAKFHLVELPRSLRIVSKRAIWILKGLKLGYTTIPGAGSIPLIGKNKRLNGLQFGPGVQKSPGLKSNGGMKSSYQEIVFGHSKIW